MAQIRIMDKPAILSSELLDTDKFLIGRSSGDKTLTIEQSVNFYKNRLDTQGVADSIKALQDGLTALQDSFIGSIQTFSTNTLPEEYLSCDGAEYLKTDYPKLYTKIGDVFGDTNLGYAAPTDADHFRVPNLLDRFIRNTDGTKAVGAQQTDTMRKIVGTTGAFQDSDAILNTGALSKYRDGQSTYGASSSSENRAYIVFDSSKGVDGQIGQVSPNVGAETAPKHTVLVFAIKAK